MMNSDTVGIILGFKIRERLIRLAPGRLVDPDWAFKQVCNPDKFPVGVMRTGKFKEYSTASNVEIKRRGSFLDSGSFTVDWNITPRQVLLSALSRHLLGNCCLASVIAYNLFDVSEEIRFNPIFGRYNRDVTNDELIAQIAEYSQLGLIGSVDLLQQRTREIFR